LENEKFDGSSGIHARKIELFSRMSFPLHTLAGYRPGAKRFFARPVITPLNRRVFARILIVHPAIKSYPRKGV